MWKTTSNASNMAIHSYEHKELTKSMMPIKFLKKMVRLECWLPGYRSGGATTMLGGNLLIYKKIDFTASIRSDDRNQTMSIRNGGSRVDIS